LAWKSILPPEPFSALRLAGVGVASQETDGSSLPFDAEKDFIGTIVGVARASPPVVCFGVNDSRKGLRMVHQRIHLIANRLGRFGVVVTLFLSLLGSACSAIPTTVPTFTPFATVDAASESTQPAEAAPLPPATSTEAVQPPTAAAADTGWQGEFFSNETWTAPATLTRSDPELVFDWQQAGPDPSLPVDAFTARWTRCLDLESRYYIFSASADDYVRVLVDDIVVLESTPPNVEIPFSVAAGNHCIKVEYREFIGFAYLNFAFRPGEPFTAVDASTAWQAEFFNNRDFAGPPTFTHNDAAPQFDWQLGNAAPGLPVDNFSARWTRCLDLEGRDYVFTAQADEYVKVLVDDLQVLEAPAASSAQTTVPISAGRHCIKVEYREDTGVASVNVSFQ
jgi:hypothetical protein